MSEIKRLLSVMKKGICYREKDLNKLTGETNHTAMSSRIYYGFLRGYIKRRKRTVRNWEYAITLRGEKHGNN